MKITGYSATDVDRRLMMRAIALSKRGEGRVEPNPMVGCVIARKDRVIAEGYHKRFGGPHAEIEALRACKDSPRGATVYVSLEPCGHHGKTPPCTEALIEARVATVFAAMRDPNPLVGGKGLARLRRAGICVRVGLCRLEAVETLAPYLTRVLLGRPYVIAKWAQSLDGKLATRTGRSKWISGEASRRRVHRVRGRVDAVMVGIGTVLADDPLLSARGVPVRRRATRVILDGRLRTPLECRIIDTSQGAFMFSSGHGGNAASAVASLQPRGLKSAARGNKTERVQTIPTLVCTTARACGTPRAKRFRRRGVELMPCRSRSGLLDLGDVLRKLARRDVTNLLVEGGPTLLASLFKKNLVDEALVFVAPIMIGGGPDAPDVAVDPSAAQVKDALRPRTLRIERIGTDVLYRMRFTPVPTSPTSIQGTSSRLLRAYSKGRVASK